MYRDGQPSARANLKPISAARLTQCDPVIPLRPPVGRTCQKTSERTKTAVSRQDERVEPAVHSEIRRPYIGVPSRYLGSTRPLCLSLPKWPQQPSFPLCSRLPGPNPPNINTAGQGTPCARKTPDTRPTSRGSRHGSHRHCHCQIVPRMRQTSLLYLPATKTSNVDRS